MTRCNIAETLLHEVGEAQAKELPLLVETKRINHQGRFTDFGVGRRSGDLVTQVPYIRSGLNPVPTDHSHVEVIM